MTTRSSCRPTARGGCTRRPACSTARCRRTTSRTSRRSRNPFYRQQANPTRQVFQRTDNLSNPSDGEPGAEVFPYVFTTYRLTEHHTAGGMSRWLPYLSELQPEFFCEVSPELAARARASSTAGGPRSSRARTAIEARVLVTDRVVPLTVGGRHDPPGRAALPLGRRRRAPSSPATRPTTCSGSPSTRTCTSRSPRSRPATSSPGRRPTGPALRRLVNDYRAAGRHHGRDRQRPADPEPRQVDRTPTSRRRTS